MGPIGPIGPIGRMPPTQTHRSYRSYWPYWPYWSYRSYRSYWSYRAPRDTKSPMTRMVLTLCAALFTAACATTPAPAPAPVTTAAAAPCNPGHTILNGTLWVQQSAEYRAAALQTYAAARRALDAALADPTWVGAEEETANDPS